MTTILTCSNHLVSLIKLIQGKDIYAYAKQERQMPELPDGATTVGNLGERHVILKVESLVIPMQEFVSGALEFRSQAQQLIIIFTGHIEVYIIVPRNETLMTDGTQNGSATTYVTKVMPLEEFLGELEHFQQTSL